LLACLIALMVFTACADGKDKTEINVNGSGEVLVAADTAVITLGITTQNKDVLEAQNTVNAAIEKIRTALIENGIKKEDINTDRLRIYAVYDYSNNVERLTAYNASSYLAIRTTDMDMVGKIIDIAFGAGANTLNDIAFSASDTEEASTEALTAAVKDARRKAEIMAAAAGLKITGIESITESYSYSGDSGVNAFYKNAVMADEATGASTLVQASKLKVSASVSIVFEAE
ncbi:MAG: SIMPL domain-containing protein, partial [Eubacteriales bacterium]|nr:SIMPL domain-containing protein [Eubacteriales bacterium]